MEIRAIRLTNVRRFVDPVEIGGLGSGINVLSAPNEQGKSTFFDALHAAFFTSHTSMKAEIKALRPHAGGDPEVVVDFVIEGAEWRLEKRWSTAPSRRSAKLWRDGTLAGQAAQAEDTLARLLAAPADGGPAGLLWVRQGLTELERKGAEETARQSLLTSVAGEVDTMTGGRQMETVRAQVMAELAQNLTATGKVRQNGPLHRAEQEVASLTTELAQRQAASTDLAEALDSRKRLRAEKARLEHPEDATARAAALKAAEAALAEAEKYGAVLAAARETERTAGIVLKTVTDTRSRLAAAISDREAALAAQDAATSARNAAQTEFENTEADFAEIRDAHDAARDAAIAARAIYQRAVAAERAQAAESKRTELSDRLESAIAAQHIAESARAEARAGPGPDVMEDLRSRNTARAAARLARESAAPAISVDYTGAGRLRRDGQEMPGATRLPFPDGATFDVDGIGRLTLYPGAASESGGLAAAEADLARALAGAGYPDVASAEAAARARADAERREAEAAASVRAAAPDGIDALREALAALPAPLEPSPDLPLVAEAAVAEEEANEDLMEAAADFEVARSSLDDARTALARADAALTAAQDRANRTADALAEHDDPALALAALETEVAARRKEQADASLRREALEAEAPDLATLRARHERAQTAIENARQSLHDTAVELRGLDTQIKARASEAIEEELADTAERLKAAERRHAAIAEECAVLQRLVSALDTAQRSARERYVAPVLRELEPLVRMLWPEAELRMDADTVLPTDLVRRGTAEDFDILSGGTREQIALLVRLAFARMLARDGRPAPVILDDAIVYSDDDRIVTMFDALTRQATDLQVIVFSCRQRAFRDLGGRSLAITPVTSATSP